MLEIEESSRALFLGETTGEGKRRGNPLDPPP